MQREKRDWNRTPRNSNIGEGSPQTEEENCLSVATRAQEIKKEEKKKESNSSDIADVKLDQD